MSRLRRHRDHPYERCPHCDGHTVWGEVHIGVRVQTGPAECPACGWCQPPADDLIPGGMSTAAERFVEELDKMLQKEN